MSESGSALSARVAGFAAAIAAVSPLASGTAAAQAGEPSQADRGFAEIIVTAQKREQRLQDVPIAVTTVSSQLLQDTGVRDIKDLTLLTSGLIVTSTSNETVTTARIRGIGTVGDNAGLESSVGVVIDGVYRPRNGVGFGDLGELERVEVLKGPQGTLFGKNTSAGVINIVTKAPEFEFGSNVELTAGNLGTLDGSVSVTGPLIGDTVAGRLNVVSRNHDGFYDVSTGSGPRTATEDADRDLAAVRGQLLIRASENLDVRLIADYSRREENCCVATQIATGSTAPIIDALSADAGVANPPDPFRRLAFADRPTDQSIRDKGVSAELNWDLGAATLTSVSAWRNWSTVNGQDSDFTTADILYRRNTGVYANEFDQLSQELRLAGETGRIDWLVGAFYAAEDLDSSLDLRYGADFEAYYSLLFSGGRLPTLVNTLTGLAPGTAYGAGQGYLDTYRQDSNAYALFTNNSISLTDRLEMTLGLRYTNEQKDLDSLYTNSDGGVGCAAARARFDIVSGALASAPPGTVTNYYNFGCPTFADPIYNNFATSQSIDESDWSGTAKLAYRFSDDVMSYVSYARGYKASGFNLDRERTPVAPAPGAPDGPPLFTPDTDTSFRPETVDSYELGAKTTWLDRTLLVNAAAFYQKFEDFQLNTFTGISFVVVSIPEVTSRGVDVDFLWRQRGSGLSLQGGVTYADTEYGNFTPPFAALFRLPGNRMSFAPKWSGSLSVTYDRPIGAGLVGRANIGAKSTSSYNTGSDLSPLKVQDAYTLVNARLGIGAQNERWMLEAWAQNLTDEEYYQVVFDATLQTGTLDAYLGAPRTYGLTLRMRF